MSAKLLSSLVQTKSIELVMAPIAAQVSQLIILNEAGEKEGIPMPMLVSHAKKISSAIHSLVLAAQTLVNESSNEVFKTEMPEACVLVTAAGNSLLGATTKLLKQPFSREIRYTLVDSARNVLETTMKVLLVYDKAEVHKIVCAACWVIDRLGLTEAVTSMDGFLVSFRGFSESLVLLVSLCDKRQRELSNPKQRSRLLSAMAILRQAVGVLSSTMQVYFKNPSLPSAKVNRDYVIGQIKFACTEIIKIVENRHEENVSETPSMSSTMQKAHHQLDPKVAMDTSNQMDCYLDAIVRSSMAVADLSTSDSRDKIVEACQNVLETRNDLTALQNTMSNTSDPVLPRSSFDETTEKLSQGLKDLDRQVTLAITEQLHDVFNDIEKPLKQLMDISTASYNGEEKEQAFMVLRQAADDFQQHGSKIVQISKHAASLSSDAEKIHVIKGTSSEIERLVPMFVSAAFTLKQNSFDQAALGRLGFLSREWMNKIQQLVDVLDDVTDMQDLLKVAGRSFYQDISELQEALEENSFVKTTEKSEGLLSKGQRFAQITKKALARTADPFNSEILTEVDGLQSGLPGLVSAVDKVLTNKSDRVSRDAAHKYASDIADKVNTIQCKVTGSPAMVKKPQAVSVINDVNAAPVPPSSNGSASSTTMEYDDLIKPISFEEQPRQQPKRMSSPSTLSVSSVESKGFYDDKRGIDQYLGEKDDEGTTWTDKKSLIGVNSTNRLFGEPIQLSRTAKAPVMSLIQAAKNGDRNNIERQIKNVISQATRLMGLAEKCVEKSQRADQVRQIRVTSAEIEKLTPIIGQAARDVTSNPRDKRAVERLHVIGREWASKAHVLGNAIDNIVVPWSAAASKLALAAASEDTVELKKQINNINDEAVRLRQLALSAIAAADAEDYAMDPGNESDDFERNPDSYQRIKLLRATSLETDKVIPELILAAQSLVVNPTDTSRLEHLEFLRRVWACNVNDLITAVDDVIVGTSAPVEHLTTAAMVSDSQALQERIRMVVSYTRTLKDMATAATAGCSNPKKAVLVESTMASIQRLTADLQETSFAVVELSGIPDKSLHQQLAFMSVEEKMKLLRREWATKVHLLTALVDDLTAHVSAPVDRLAGAALAVTKADLSQRPLLEREFEVQAQELSSRVARVRSQASKAVEHSSHAGQVRSVRVTGDFIDRLTPQVIGSARALADNPDQPTVEHFQLLRRQWASKANMLIATLRELHDANANAVQSVVENLLAARAIQPATSFESLTENDFSQLLSSSPGESKLFDSLPVSTTPSPQPVKKAAPPKTKPRPNKQKDREKVDRRAVSDSEEPPKPRVPIGASSSETDLRSLLVAELHDRFSSNESLKRSKWDARYWAKFEVNRKKKHQRAFSMADLSTNKISESTEDLRNRKSSKSIERAARFLEDEVDQWEEHNNSIVQVAKKMAQQMMQMAEFARRRGKLQNKVEMTNTAKAIAANSRIIQNFAQVIADACADDRSREDLLYYAECLPTMSTQLSILSSVKAAAPTDPSADAMLVRNADNLMQAVVKTLRAAEAASVKEFVKPPPSSSDAAEAADLTFLWKKKLQRQRKKELFTGSRDHLGLRRRAEHKPTPSLADIVHV